MAFETDFLMQVAWAAANKSKATKMRVGAVIADSMGNIISTGRNGTMRGSSNVCEAEQEDGSLITLDTVIHAEMNAILHAARRGISVEGATMVCTHSPCMRCATHMFQAGITSVIYDREYRLHNEVVNEVGKYMSLRKNDGK
jgi:dCMP deaminase